MILARLIVYPFFIIVNKMAACRKCTIHLEKFTVLCYYKRVI